MLRCLLLCLALCLSTAPPQASAATATLDIGGAAVRLEVPEGYVRVSERSPQLLVFQQGMLPQSNRLVEALLTEADLVHLLSGSKAMDVAYQVQAMRGMETVVIDASQWSQLRSATIEQMGGLDMGQVLDTVERQANSTLDAATGGEAGIRFGDPSQPALYAIDDKDAVHFSMVLPVELHPHGPLRALHERIKTSGLPLGASRHAFTPHVTLSLYRTPGRDEVRELLAVRVTEPVVVDHLVVSLTEEPYPPRPLFELPLG